MLKGRGLDPTRIAQPKKISSWLAPMYLATYLQRYGVPREILESRALGKGASVVLSSMALIRLLLLLYEAMPSES